MADETPIVTTTTPGGSSGAAKPKAGALWRSHWWVPVSFVVPFAVIYICLGMGASDRLNFASCFRSGAIGLAAAIFVLTLWKIDQKVQNDKVHSPVGPMIGMLGMALWLGWVIAAHVVVLANDEANYLAADYQSKIEIAAPAVASKPGARWALLRFLNG